MGAGGEGRQFAAVLAAHLEQMDAVGDFFGAGDADRDIGVRGIGVMARMTCCRTASLNRDWMRLAGKFDATRNRGVHAVSTNRLE